MFGLFYKNEGVFKYAIDVDCWNIDIYPREIFFDAQMCTL